MRWTAKLLLRQRKASMLRVFEKKFVQKEYAPIPIKFACSTCDHADFRGSKAQGMLAHALKNPGTFKCPNVRCPSHVDPERRACAVVTNGGE